MSENLYVTSGRYAEECREFEDTGKPYIPEMPMPAWFIGKKA